MSQRAVLYARVSGDDRQNEGRNLAGQLAMCREYARAHGYEVVAELSEDDRGASGAAFELPQLAELRRMAEQQAFDVLVVREIDRLSRNLAKQLIVEEELLRSGVTIEYVIGEYADDPEGRLSKHIKATIAEYEREKIRERMARGRRLKVAAGNVHVYGRPPYGYRVVTSPGREMLEVREDEAAIIRQIFTWYTVGDDEHGPYSLRGIRRLLTDRKIPSPCDGGRRTNKQQGWGEWATTTVAHILHCETYIGVWRFAKSNEQRNWRYFPEQEHDPALAVQVPAIIDRQTWDLARARLLQNRTKRAGNVQQPYLLRGRLRCAACGAAVASYTGAGGHGTPRYRYYRCAPASGKRGYDMRNCHALSVSAQTADEVAWEWLKGLLLDDTLLLRGLRELQESAETVLAPIRDRLATVARDLEDCQAQMAKLLDLYLANTLPRTLLDERSARLQEQAQALKSEAKALQARLDTQVITDERIADAQAFAAFVAKRLLQDDSFEVRQFVVETLDVRGELTATAEARWVDLRCSLGDTELLLSSKTTHPAPRAG